MPEDTDEPAPDLATVSETASELRCSEKTVYTLITSGKLGAVKIGGRWLIGRDAIDTVRAMAGVTSRPNMRSPHSETLAQKGSK